MFNNKGSFFVGSEKQSEPVPIGSFLWSADNSRECALIDQRDQLCTILTCRPKEDSPTLLWTCLAKASFSHEDRTAPKEAVYHMWVGRFDHKGMEVHVHSERSSYRAAYRAISPSPAYALPLGKVEIQIINGLHSLHCDFSSSKNLFVQGSEAVKIKVEGKELHIAKKVFDEAIPKDFEKKAKNVKLDKFLYYLGAANGVRVTKSSVEHQLELAELFENGSIIDRCEDFLLCADVPNLDKFRLAIQYELTELLLLTVKKSSLEDLRAYPRVKLNKFALELIAEKASLY